MIGSAEGDRIGRKRVILLALLVMGAFSLITAATQTLPQLVAARFLVGLGLGGAMPNIIALTAEYSPARLRSRLITGMFIGFPIGAVVGGVFAAKLIAAFGWQSLFVVGGVLPLALIPIVMIAMPESVRFLAGAERSQAKANAIARKIAPDLTADINVLRSDPYGTKPGSIGELFAQGRTTTTLTLWAVCFCTLLVMYLLINWLPVVLSATGMPREKAILGTVLFNLGGAIGGLTIARSLDLGHGRRALQTAYIFGAILTGLIGFATSDMRLALALVFAAGFCVVGAQLGMNAFAATFYETRIRSTGVGWALGIGRIGSIVGPVIGGNLIGLGADTRTMFLVAAAPVVFCFLGMILLSKSGQRAANHHPVQFTGAH